MDEDKKKASTSENESNDDSTSTRPKIKFLESPEMAALFERKPCWPTYHVKLNVDNQISMPKAVYSQLKSLTNSDLEISEDEFVNIWRALILLRGSDVCWEKFRGYAYCDISLIPAPLADLLEALGSGIYPATKQRYVIAAYFSDSRDKFRSYWGEGEVRMRWNLAMKNLEGFYQMRKYPPKYNNETSQIFFCSRKEIDGFVTIRSSQLTVTSEEAMIRALNDELFDPPPLTYEGCILPYSDRIELATSRASYASFYVIHAIPRH